MPVNFPNSLDSFVSPTAADKLNTPTVVHHVKHTEHDQAIQALEAKLGINFSGVTGSVDYGLNLLLLTETQHPSGTYKEVTPFGNPFPTLITWYTSNTKTIKLVDKGLTYDTKKNPITIVYNLYDGTVGNVVKRTITDTITYSGPFEISRDRTVV